MRWNLSSIRWLYGGLIVCLVVVSALGVAREHRASVLSAPIFAGISAELRFADALEVTRRVASRFRYIDEHGPLGDAASWPLRTAADHLLTGGDCGDAAGALGAVFISRGRSFRIIQVNLAAAGASHIMLETPDDAQRWVLIDPIEGHAFPRPLDGRLLGIEEIRALPDSERAWLADEYRSGESSLFTPYRRTNWTRLGPLADIVRAVAGDEWMREHSLRAAMLQADRRLTESAMVAMVLLAIAIALTERTFARKVKK